MKNKISLTQADVDALVKKEQKRRMREFKRRTPPRLFTWLMKMVGGKHEYPTDNSDVLDGCKMAAGVGIFQLFLFAGCAIFPSWSFVFVLGWWEGIWLLLALGTFAIGQRESSEEERENLDPAKFALIVLLFGTIVSLFLIPLASVFWTRWFYKDAVYDQGQLAEMERQASNVDAPAIVYARLLAMVDKTETVLLGKEAPLHVIRGHLDERIRTIAATREEIAGRIKRAPEPERRQALGDAVAAADGILAQLRSQLARHDALIARAQAEFARCRSSLSGVAGAVGDRELIQRLARETDRAAEDLAASEESLQACLTRIIERIIELRAIIGEGLAEPSARLFLRVDADSLKDDMRICEELADSVYVRLGDEPAPHTAAAKATT